jgi:hypothetical protein
MGNWRAAYRELTQLMSPRGKIIDVGSPRAYPTPNYAMENRAPETQVPSRERQGHDNEAHESPAEHTSPNPQQDPGRKGANLPATNDDSLAFLKSLADASAVFVAFTYIGGWSYLASYYSSFGLNPLELDLSVPVVSTAAVVVLLSALWPLLVVVVLALGWIFLGNRLRHRSHRGVTAGILALLLLGASVAGVIDGRWHATDDMLLDSSELPYVAFSTRLLKTDQPSCIEYQTYGSFDCKLLLHSKGTYYFFTPVPKPKEALISVGSLNVYTLADSDVTGVHILRGLERNAREK